ncbi:MAG: AAA family ATPase, partial [Leptolyngbya sp. SIO3F4]|nr:AAA family ATPase [Leptolyngbya sp. SIO3F4]
MHVKRVELSHFKSFGGTTQVPLLQGFTVISGPNGSGKSNILDALLFCLGLASSKGMRAERLPDLVNQNHANRRSTSEASVTVTFDISDLGPEFLQEEVDESNSQINQVKDTEPEINSSTESKAETSSQKTDLLVNGFDQKTEAVSPPQSSQESQNKVVTIGG